MSAVAATVLSENHRGIVFKCTGDGASTQITVTSNNYFSRVQSGTNFATNIGNDVANAFVFDTPTIFDYPSSSDVTGYKATGMLVGHGGTQLTVNSVSIAAGTQTSANPTTVITITLSAALTNAHAIQGWLAWVQDRPTT